MIHLQNEPKLPKASQIIICDSEQLNSMSPDAIRAEINELQRFAEEFPIFTIEEKRNLFAATEIDQTEGIRWVSSDFPGQGKSSWIKSRKPTYSCLEVQVFGDFNDRDFFECVKLAGNFSNESFNTMYIHVNIHLTKLTEKVVYKLDRFLYELCYLKVIPQFDCFVCLHSDTEILIEVSNDNKETLENQLAFYHLIQHQKTDITLTQPSFRQSLQSDRFYNDQDFELLIQRYQIQDQIPLNKSQIALLRTFIDGESRKSPETSFELLGKTGWNLIVNGFYKDRPNNLINFDLLQPDERFNMSHKVPKFNSKDKECVYIRKLGDQVTRYLITQTTNKEGEPPKWKEIERSKSLQTEEEIVTIDLANPSNNYQDLIEEMFVTDNLRESSLTAGTRMKKLTDDFKSRCQKFENNKKYIVTVTTS
jgi:hypothetical protein